MNSCKLGLDGDFGHTALPWRCWFTARRKFSGCFINVRTWNHLRELALASPCQAFSWKKPEDGDDEEGLQLTGVFTYNSLSWHVVSALCYLRAFRCTPSKILRLGNLFSAFPSLKCVKFALPIRAGAWFPAECTAPRTLFCSIYTAAWVNILAWQYKVFYIFSRNQRDSGKTSEVFTE